MQIALEFRLVSKGKTRLLYQAEAMERLNKDAGLCLAFDFDYLHSQRYSFWCVVPNTA